MEELEITLNGVTYIIKDNSVGDGLSITSVENVLNNLSETMSYSSMVSGLANSDNPEHRTVVINIDIPGGSRTAVIQNADTLEFEININSSEFEDGFNYPIPDVNYQPMQNMVDMALMHEIAHVHDLRINGADYENNLSQGERTAIQRENALRAELGLPLRAPDGHGDISPEQIQEFRADIFWNGGIFIDPDPSSDLNFIPDAYYQGNAPTEFPLTQYPGVQGLPVVGLSLANTRFIFQKVKEAIDNGVELGEDLVNEISNELTARQANIHEDVSNWLEEVLAEYGVAENNLSPLVLDLDGDGIELVSLANSTTYWDIDEDGFAETSGWVAPDDGFLAIDINGDGVINDHGELFGSNALDGFSVLEGYDSNGDGVITADDDAYGNLLVWQDINQNGLSEASELSSLIDLNIVSIDVNASESNATNQGHGVPLTSSYTVDDGLSGAQTLEIADVYFNYDDTNTTHNQSYDLDVNALFLPTARGYGTLPDMHIALSLDNDQNDPTSLMSLMQSFATKSFEDVFTSDGGVVEEATAIMYRWAGVDGVDPDSRGPNIDARKLEFLEELTGQDFLQRGYLENPGSLAGVTLDGTFHIAQQNIAARLMAQTSAGDLFEGEWSYNVLTDSFDGITGLNQDILDQLITEASGVADAYTFWLNVVRMVDLTVGVDALPSEDQDALEDAIVGDGSNGLSISALQSGLDFDAPDGVTLNGSNTEDDVLIGGIGNDRLNGNSGNDTLFGGAGNDELIGERGDDHFHGQAGQDYAVGFLGNDTYYYSLGGGNDVYREQGTGDGNDQDRIIFGEGITQQNIELSRAGNNDLEIKISTSTDESTIIIEDQMNYSAGGGYIEFLEFSDGSLIQLDQLSYTLVGTDRDEIFTGSRDTSSTGIDTIFGGGGNDNISAEPPNLNDLGENFLYGEAGNDTLDGGNGNDILDGGSGNDTLTGQRGDDVLIYNVSENVGARDVYDGEIGSDTLRLVLTSEQNADQAIQDDIAAFNAFLNDPAGEDSFTFSQFDLTVEDIENLEIVIENTAPDAVDDVVSGDQDTILSGSVLDNDSDVDDDDLSVVADTFTTINGGDVVLLGDGTFTYTPAEGFFGVDSFDYTVLDGQGGEDVATVTLTVNEVIVVPVNTAPDAQDDSFAVDEDGELTGNVLGNDSDVDGDALIAQPQNIQTVNGGAVSLLANGDFTYTPAQNYNGPDSFSYVVDDGNEGFDTATVNITVNAVNDGPEAVDDSFVVDEDVELSGTLLDNDTDADGDGLSVVAGTFTTAQGGSVVVNADGSFVYTPTDNFNGADSFTYTVEDGQGGSDSANVDITVNAVNDGPVANDDAGSGDEDTVLSGNVLGNDTDIDGDVLSVVATTLTTANGGEVVLLEDGSYTYTPAENFNGLDSFDYTLVDGNGGQDTGTVNLGVTSVNDGPVAQDDQSTGDEGETLQGNVLANDSDIDGGVLSVVAGTYTTAQGGAVEVFENGDFTYNGAEGFFGVDSFDYTVLDGQGGQDVASVNLTVNEIVDVPDILGTEGRDYLWGTNEGESISGLGGRDIILSRGGDDTVDGGSGNDHIYGGSGDDDLNGGTGRDKLIGGHGDDVMRGGEGNDLILDNRGSNELYGGAGNDKLFVWGHGDNYLDGGEGNDRVYGGRGDDVLIGGAGNDKLYGGNGDDIIVMGEGRDKVYGGRGDDQFVFDQFDVKTDTIYGFEMGENGDVINLTDVLESYDPVYDDIMNFIEISQSRGNTEIKVNADGDAGGEFTTIAVIEDCRSHDVNLQELLDAGNLVVDQSASILAV